MKSRWILLAGMALMLTGCGQKVMTVADVQTEEGEEAQYIEMQEFELKEKKESSDREEVQYCAVLIPAGYHESENIPGMYLHEKSPLDSSNIYYTVSEGSSNGRVSEALTEDIYEQMMEEAYAEAGQAVDVTIESFEEIDMEGVPCFKIRSSGQLADEEAQMEQLAYLILAEDTYTITYSQMSDDELMADFEISDGGIKLIRDENVSLAKN